MELLIPAPALQRRHCLHQKSIREQSNLMNRLLKSDFDLEPETVGTNNRYGIHRRIRTHQYPTPMCWVDNNNKTYALLHGFPKQIGNKVPKRDALLSIYGAYGL